MPTQERRQMAVRRITADTRDHIRRLADILYEFLPLTTASKRAVTFRTIFAESGIGHYLEGDTKKRPYRLHGRKSSGATLASRASSFGRSCQRQSTTAATSATPSGARN